MKYVNNSVGSYFSIVEDIKNFYTILDKNGNIVAEPIYTEIKYRDGLYLAFTDIGTMCVLSEEGKIIIPIGYVKISFMDNIILAQTEKKEIFIYD